MSHRTLSSKHRACKRAPFLGTPLVPSRMLMQGFEREVARRDTISVGCEQMGSTLMWPLHYFRQTSVKQHETCSDPISADPICPFPFRCSELQARAPRATGRAWPGSPARSQWRRGSPPGGTKRATSAKRRPGVGVVVQFFGLELIVPRITRHLARG